MQCLLQVLELTPVNALEPPKEKPPPPPVDAYPDDDSQVQLPLEPVSINYYLLPIINIYDTEFCVLLLRNDA